MMKKDFSIYDRKLLLEGQEEKGEGSVVTAVKCIYDLHHFLCYWKAIKGNIYQSLIIYIRVLKVHSLLLAPLCAVKYFPSALIIPFSYAACKFVYSSL